MGKQIAEIQPKFVRKKLYHVIASREMKSSTEQAGEVQIGPNS